MPADLILTNGRIHTAETSSPTAEAIAIRKDRIAAIGSAADVEATARPGTRRVDLGGRTVVPGLIDSHTHMLDFGLSLSRVDLLDVPSIDEALSRVRKAAEAAAPGDWILGNGWNKNVWSRDPSRTDLDAVAPNNPVMLVSKDMHAHWSNSLALKLAKVEASTPDPADGKIARDDRTGDPTGILWEGAGWLIRDAMPQPSAERCEAALLLAMNEAVSKGITSVHVVEGARSFGGFSRLRARGDLLLRVCSHLWKEGLEDAARLQLRTWFGDEWHRLGNLKMFLDGALGSQTAHMLEPYDGTDNTGVETMTKEEFRGWCVAAISAGFAPDVHAIGDAANRVALDVLEELAPMWKALRLRPRIEHLQVLHSDDAARPGKIGIIASMQPTHQPSDWEMANRYHSKRNDYAYAWRTMLDTGAVLAFGSDVPVEHIDPMLGLYAAVTRQTADGKPEGGWHPEQRLTPMEALSAFTMGGAYSSGEEAIKGSLSAGKLADLAVLSDDPFAGPPELFLQTKVLATVVGGKVVYGSL